MPLDPPASLRWRRWEVLAMLVVLTLALVVRWQAARHGLSFDEIWMLAGASGHGVDCLSRWDSDTLLAGPQSPTSLEHARSVGAAWSEAVPFHPPLFPVALWTWRAVFGGSDWTASMHSAAWSTAAIAFIFAALRLQAGAGPAICVALLLALSPFQIQLGTEVRGYGMMLGIAACAAWQIARIETLGPTRCRAWMLGLTLLPLQLTHYFAAGACTAICIWALLRLRGSLRWHFLAAVGCAAAVAATAWLPFMLAHLELADGREVDFLRTAEPFWRGAGRAALLLPAKLLFLPSSHRWAFAALSVALLALVAVGAVRGAKATAWALFLFVPIAMLATLDLVRDTMHVAFTRYAAIASIGVAAAPILSAFEIRKWLGWCVAAALVATSIAGMHAPRNVGSQSLHHARVALLPAIAAESQALPIVCSTRDAGELFGRAALLEWSHAPGVFPRPAMLLTKPAPDALAALAAAAPEGRFWLFTSSPNGPSDEFPDWLRERVPSARPVRPPIYVPAGNKGVQPEPAAELWLLEFDDSTRERSPAVR